MITRYLPHPQLVPAIAALRPGARWIMTEAEVTWLEDIEPPTQADIDAQIKSAYIIEGWEQIKLVRDTRQAAGVKVDGYWFHTDADSQLKYFGLMFLGANIPEGLWWKTMTGDFVVMTQALVQKVFQTIAYTQTVIFNIAEQHKAAMEASTDPTSYDFRVGWPLVFTEVDPPVIEPDEAVMDDSDITVDLYPYEEPSLTPEE
jgi:hypothetical protein